MRVADSQFHAAGGLSKCSSSAVVPIWFAVDDCTDIVFLAARGVAAVVAADASPRAIAACCQLATEFADCAPTSARPRVDLEVEVSTALLGDRTHLLLGILRIDGNSTTSANRNRDHIRAALQFDALQSEQRSVCDDDFDDGAACHWTGSMLHGPQASGICVALLATVQRSLGVWNNPQ